MPEPKPVNLSLEAALEQAGEPTENSPECKRKSVRFDAAITKDSTSKRRPSKSKKSGVSKTKEHLVFEASLKIYSKPKESSKTKGSSTGKDSFKTSNSSETKDSTRTNGSSKGKKNILKIEDAVEVEEAEDASKTEDNSTTKDASTQTPDPVKRKTSSKKKKPESALATFLKGGKRLY